MKKITILLFILFSTGLAFAQKKSNPKIGKNETEITSFILAEDRLAFGGQFIYRLPLKKRFKIGPGILYAANYNNAFGNDMFGYGAAFADIMLFIGHRQKWSFGGQLGHGFHNRNFGGLKLKPGIYYTISGNYRVIVSKKLLITTSLFTGYRNFHYDNGVSSTDPGFVGLKAGVVF